MQYLIILDFRNEKVIIKYLKKNIDYQKTINKIINHSDFTYMITDKLNLSIK